MSYKAISLNSALRFRLASPDFARNSQGRVWAKRENRRAMRRDERNHVQFELDSTDGQECHAWGEEPEQPLTPEQLEQLKQDYDSALIEQIERHGRLLVTSYPDADVSGVAVEQLFYYKGGVWLVVHDDDYFPPHHVRKLY